MQGVIIQLSDKNERLLIKLTEVQDKLVNQNSQTFFNEVHLMKKESKMILVTVIAVLIALTCGAFLDFYPFLGDDLIVREIQFCTFLICVVIAVCTAIISKKK